MTLCKPKVFQKSRTSNKKRKRENGVMIVTEANARVSIRNEHLYQFVSGIMDILIAHRMTAHYDKIASFHFWVLIHFIKSSF